MDEPDGLLQVFTTTDKEGEAQHIATSLVEKSLAACVQVIGPIRSTYRWQGTVETSNEWLVLAKTSDALLEAVESEITRLHSYDVPEIIAVPIIAGSNKYLIWLESELSSSPSLRPADPE